MTHQNENARINVKVLVILLLVIGAVGISLFAARQIRRSRFSQESLAAGLAAYDRQDWPKAVKHLGSYLSKHDDDVDVARKYAESCLSIHPLDNRMVSGAIWAYRRVIEWEPDDEAAYSKLAMLYKAIGNFQELEQIARMRLEHVPEDAKATFWLAEALTRLTKTDEAKQVLRSLADRIEAVPERSAEYVRACVAMSRLLDSETSGQPQPEKDSEGKGGAETEAGTDAEKIAGPQSPLQWLDRAVAHAPDSAEAFVCRAQYYRQVAEKADTSETDRQTLMMQARSDLEKAEILGTQNPLVAYSLATEWMLHRQFDRADAGLQALEKLSQDRLQEHFFDLSDWSVARFLLAAELATLKGADTDAVSLADDILASLTDARHRVRVLLTAIPLYVTAGRVSEARECLNEYIETAQERGIEVDSRNVAWLKGLVEAASNKPYAVIDVLESSVGYDVSSARQWRLLAEAYGQTGQAARAVHALTQYLRFYPQDSNARLELARQYSRLRDWSNAFEMAALAESGGTTDPLVKLLRIGAGINLAIARGQNIDAAKLDEYSEELANLRQQYPDQVKIRLLQAVLFDFLGRPEETEKELKLAVQECKEPLQAQLQLARHYFRSQRTEEAMRVCQTACEQHSKVAKPWFLLSDLHLAAEDVKATRDCLAKALTVVPEGKEKKSVSIRLAFVELVYGDRSAGINLLIELAAQDEQDVRTRLLLLRTSEVRQDATLTERLINELQKAEGQSGLWWRLQRASAWLSSEEWSDRQKDITELLQHCIVADRTWISPVLLLAGLYERLGDPMQAENLYWQGLLSNPSAAALADRLLAILENQGRFVDAEGVLRQIGKNPRAQFWRPRILAGMGNFSRAIEEYRLRVSNDSQDASSRIQLARLLYEQEKNAEQAFQYLEEAKVLTPESRFLKAVTVSILRGEGRDTDALQVLDEYVAEYNHFDAYWLRAVYSTEEGNLEQAEQDYKKLTTFAQRSEAGYNLLANFYAGDNRMDQGIIVLEESLRTYPESLRIKRWLMQMLFLRDQEQDRDRAITILAELEEKQPQDAELMMTRAIQIMEESSPESLALAKERLENAVQRDPRSINAHLALIEVLMRQQDLLAACDCAVRALKANPGNKALLLARARAELKLGYAPTAFKLARQALQGNTDNTEALSLLAGCAVAGKEPGLLEEAQTMLDSAIGRDPSSERLLLARAHVLSALGTPKLAIADLDAYCQDEGSTSIMALVTLADLYRLSGDPERAGQWVERAKQVDPNHQAVVHARFLWLVSQNRLEELVGINSAYRAAKEQNLSTVLRSASMLAAMDSPALREDALRLFEHAVSLSPKSLEARRGWARTLSQTDKVEQARMIYEELLKEHPDDTQVLNDLAWILQEHDHEYEAALKLANRGLRLAPYNVYLRDTRGTILLHMEEQFEVARGDFEEILDILRMQKETLLKEPPDDNRVLNNLTRRQAKTQMQLARICVKTEELDKAKEYWRKALEIDQGSSILTAGERSEITEGLRN